MTFAQIGPLTSMLEAVATAVGAGILLGGFVTGFAGLIEGRPRRELENRILADGYRGGALGAGVVLVDLILRYAT